MLKSKGYYVKKNAIQGHATGLPADDGLYAPLFVTDRLNSFSRFVLEGRHDGLGRFFMTPSPHDASWHRIV